MASRKRSKPDRKLLLAAELRRSIRRAVKAGRTGDEICGLLVDNGWFLQLVPLKNKARAPGSFLLGRNRVREARKAARRFGYRVVGAYHSHPVSPPVPGEADIAGARRGDLMLILDAFEQKLGLWRIGQRKATRVPFRLLKLR